MILPCKKIPSILLFISMLSILPLNSYPKTISSKKYIESGGHGLQIVLPATAFMSSYFLKDTTGQVQFLQSFFFNLTATYALKISLNKKRPHGGRWSFPSGHTSASFQAAAFIEKRYGFKYAVYAYLGALFVGFSRLHAGKHYLEDVIAGAVLGIASSYGYSIRYISFRNNILNVNIKLKF